MILTTLARLVPLFPTLHRASHPALATLSLKFLNGSAPHPTSRALLEAATRLYTNLHFTGGKVGAPNLWRRTVDETLASAWTTFFALRTTFQNEGTGFSILIDMYMNSYRSQGSSVIKRRGDSGRPTRHRPSSVLHCCAV